MADVTTPFGFPYPEDTDLVRDGASDIENLAEGVNDYLAGGYLYAGTRYYTSSGTFAKADAFGDTSNVVPRAIRVRMVGGGGGSTGFVGANNRGGSGGGGGAYAESFITDIAGLDASVTVTRGAGGAAAASGDNSGGDGGTSSFGALVSAEGGQGGLYASVNQQRTGGRGGTVGVGDVVFSGNGGGAGSNESPVSGSGGGSVFGGGRNGRHGTLSNGTGQAGDLYGGGASGSYSGSNASSNLGGAAGGAGIIIVDVFV
jgi:hypothetical protein